LGGGGPQEGPNATFNFQGIDAFWTLVAVLESDTEPTDSQWDSFFSAPGYSRLTEEFGRDYFKTALQAVFMPSKGHLEEEMLRDYAERGGFLGWYTPLVLEGFKEASEDREWLGRRVQELKTYPYLERASDLARTFWLLRRSRCCSENPLAFGLLLSCGGLFSTGISTGRIAGPFLPLPTPSCPCRRPIYCK
jgi:hypothetical protein